MNLTIARSTVQISTLCLSLWALPRCSSENNQDLAVDASPDTEPDSTSFDNSGTDTDNAEDAFQVEIRLASEEDPSAPGTIGIVTWSIADITPETATIHFGLDTGYGMVAPCDLNEPEHRTLLLGMKANRTYHFLVEVESNGKTYTSKDYTVTTGPVTNLVSIQTRILKPSTQSPGFIISESMSDFVGGGNSTVFIVDKDGDVVWWYRCAIGRVSRAFMSYDGKSMWMVPDRGDFDSAPLERVSMDTLETDQFNVGASHDATAVDADTIAYIDYGEGDCGSVFELDNAGNKKEIFESSTYFPGLVPPECHMNAVHYNETLGVYTVSDRDHEIFVIDRQGAIQWRLTDIVSNTVWSGEQHGHQLLENSILLFANLGGQGSGRDQNSAVFEFSLSDGREILKYDPGVFSVWLGDGQRLPNGNTLATFSIAGVIQETDPNGNLIMEMTGSTFGYSSWRPTLYGPPVDIRF